MYPSVPLLRIGMYSFWILLDFKPLTKHMNRVSTFRKDKFGPLKFRVLRLKLSFKSDPSYWNVIDPKLLKEISK